MRATPACGLGGPVVPRARAGIDSVDAIIPSPWPKSVRPTQHGDIPSLAKLFELLIVLEYENGEPLHEPWYDVNPALWPVMDVLCT